MKNKTLKITVTAIGIFCSLSAFAQQTVHPKTPRASTPVMAVPVPATETKLHETAGKQSSITGAVAPAKGNDNKPEATRAPQQKPLPETNKIVPPNQVKGR